GGFTAVMETMLQWKAQQDLKDISTDAKRGLLDLVTTKKPDGSYQGFAPGKPPRCYKGEHVQIGIKRNGQPRTVSRWIPDPKYWARGKIAWRMAAQDASYKDIHKKTRLFKGVGGYSTFF